MLSSPMSEQKKISCNRRRNLVIERIIRWVMQKMRLASMLTAFFTKQGIRYADRQERLLNGRKRKLLFLRQAKKQFTSRKKKFDQYRLQAEKRHRSREKNLLSKKLRPLNGIKEPSRPGEHRNRL